MGSEVTASLGFLLVLCVALHDAAGKVDVTEPGAAPTGSDLQLISVVACSSYWMCTSHKRGSGVGRLWGLISG